jgi:hypothetical protein
MPAWDPLWPLCMVRPFCCLVRSYVIHLIYRVDRGSGGSDGASDVLRNVVALAVS